LWTTNGTAAGTQELTDIGGANSAGVTPTDLTVFNGKALFNGDNTAGDLGLWVTNGTAIGTQEVTGIAAAAATGIDPTDLVVFDNEVLFNGVDTSGLSGLWVTRDRQRNARTRRGSGRRIRPVGIKPDRPHSLQRPSPVQRPRR
jgi:ELWxxDGT repeat protein